MNYSEFGVVQPALLEETETRSVLVVDDERPVRDIIARHLGRRGFTPFTAGGGREALQMLEEVRPMAVVADIQMPGVDGLELLPRILEFDPHTVVILITGIPSVALTIQALRSGAADCLPKPLNFSDLVKSLDEALSRRRARLERLRHEMLLETQVSRRTSELEQALGQLRRTNEQLRDSYQESIELLRRASAYRDDETGHHINRIRLFSREIAAALGLDPEDVDIVSSASPMHDIGKIGIPDQILRKPGKLTPEEYKVIQTHAAIGAQILAGSETPLLRASETIALTHHERWDGKGYPAGLAGDDIPLFGRIVAICDVWDALTHERCYKAAMPYDEALPIIHEGRGTQFDPDVVDAFDECVPRLIEIDQGFGK